MTTPHDPEQLDMFSGFDLETTPAARRDKTADARPLPLIIADKWNFVLQHHVIDGVYWFSVQDWFRGVMQKEDVRRDIDQIKRDKQMSTNNRRLKYRANDGKFYQRDYVQDADLYRMAQRMDAKTGIRKAVLEYLVKAGVTLDAARRDKTAAASLSDSLDAMHNRARSEGKKGRNVLTGALVETHIIGKPDFAAVTNAEYENLFGAGKRELCRLLSIPEDSNNLRDNLNSYALLALMTAELSAADLMQQVGRLLTTNEQVKIARDACEDVRPMFERVAAKAGQTLTAPRLTDGSK